jgi:hypothetical protein
MSMIPLCRQLSVLAVFASPSQCAPERPLRVSLFEFEQGVEGWIGNPWGGGKCGAEAAGEAKFGKGCLRGWYAGVEKGANVICPYFPDDASWRQLPWGGISFYLKGDGSPGKVTLQLETDEEQHATYSRSVPLEDTQWLRVYLPFSTFWNRGGQEFNPARMRRFYFGTSSTHHFFVDQIQLEAPHREVALTPSPVTPAPDANGAEKLGPPSWYDYGQGLYGARLDVSPLRPQGGALTLRAELRFEGQTSVGEDRIGGDGPVQRELFTPVLARLDREGEAEVRFSLVRADGQSLSAHAFRYKVFLPAEGQPTAPPLPLVPAPKEVALSEGDFALAPKVAVYALGAKPVDGRVTGLLSRELKRWYGIDVELGAGNDAAGVLLYKHAKGGPVPPAVPLPAELAGRLNGLADQGYLLTVVPNRVVLAANDDAGLYYAAQTFLQSIELTTVSPDAPRARCCVVVDWPSLRWRALSEPLPTDRWGHPNDAPVDVGFFCDYIERFIARRKFNALVLLTRQGVKLDSHPEISGPAAWTKDELRRVIDTCRANFIEPIPLVDSYGHAAWMSLSHKELWEDGGHEIVCSSNPETFKILTDVYAELLELFAPVRYFHLGLDEVWWQTLDVPEEKRCKLCAGIPKWQLFADQVNRLHAWLKERGVRSMMWSDVLLPEHNGAAPYHGARALKLIPTDIVQTNWSTSLAPNSNKLLRDLGCEVWQSNSRGVNREQAEYCTGNTFGVWSKAPWWSDAPWRSGGGYSYLNYPIAAENSWNLWPDVKTLQPPLSWAEVRKHEGALCSDAQEPEPAASGQTFFVDLPANLSSKASDPPAADHWFGATADADLRNVPRGEVQVGGVPFRVLEAPLDCAAPSPPGTGTVMIPVGRKAASLRFLHTAHLVPGSEESFYEGFKKGANWLGIPMGAYTVTYEDGATDQCPILYISNIKRWETGEAIPYVFRSVGYLFAATEKRRQQDPNARDISFYVAQWVNPHPEKMIRFVEVSGCTEVVPVVFAVTGREPRG